METKHVQAGKDTILAFVDRASAVDAVAELIWNGLDAEATRIDVTIGLTDLGLSDEIVASDTTILTIPGEGQAKVGD